MRDSLPSFGDARVIAQQLARAFESAPAVGYLAGKTQMRDWLLVHFELSCVEAETLIDNMEADGKLVFTGDPSHADAAEATWVIQTT